MSNHLAIATVTAALRKSLQDALDGADPQVAGARVTTTRPNAPQADLPNPGANIFLYQTIPSAALRGIDLPTRTGDATVIQRPQAALDLHYLVTFHGADARLEPQVMLGIVTRALHERPVLTRAAIESTLADPTFDFLQGADLADAIDLVRFSPIGLTIEEMSKLWSIFYQIPYVLSVAYRAAVVLIEGALSAQHALLVRVPRVRLQALTGPVVDRVVSATPGQQNVWILPGEDVVLVGQHLLAPVTRVRFDDIEVVPAPAAMTDERIQVTVPAALAAGVHGVQVVHRSTAEPASLAASSNVAAFVLHPTITAQLVNTDVQVTFTPPVGRTQHVTLLLNEVPAPEGRASRAYALRAPARPPSAPDTAATLTIPLTGVAPGSYLVRVQVDGAESPLVFDTTVNAYNAPKLTIA